MSFFQRHSRHGVRDSSQNLPLADFFSRSSHDGNSTNGLQSRSRKWLLAFTTSMFALSTLYWVLSVVFTFRLGDMLSNSIRACYGMVEDKASLCLLKEFASSRVSPTALLAMFDDVLFVNVSRVQ